MTDINDPLNSLPLAQLDPIASLLGTDSQHLVAQFSIPFIDVLNSQLLPAIAVTWACLGIVLYDSVINFQYDMELIRKWRKINILYFALRYTGIASMVCYTIWTFLGNTPYCQSTVKTAVYTQAFVILAASSIFYTRIATLTNRNKLVLLIFAIIALGNFAALIRAAISVYGLSSPWFAPLASCIPGEKNLILVAIPCFITVLYDLGVLFITLLAVRRFRKDRYNRPVLEDGVTTASTLKWILLRDNLVYVGIVSVIELAQGLLVLFHSGVNPVVRIILTPVATAVTVVLGCRVFIKLRFVGKENLISADDTLVRANTPKYHGQRRPSSATTTSMINSAYPKWEDQIKDKSQMSLVAPWMIRTRNTASPTVTSPLPRANVNMPFQPDIISAAEADEVGMHAEHVVPAMSPRHNHSSSFDGHDPSRHLGSPRQAISQTHVDGIRTVDAFASPRLPEFSWMAPTIRVNDEKAPVRSNFALGSEHRRW